MRVILKKLSTVAKADIGSVYERLTVVGGPMVVFQSGANRKQWECLCICGVVTRVLDQSLRSGSTRSCGCFMREYAGERSKKHGHATTKQSKTYRAWRDMLSRCTNSGHKSYPNYGGRGIGYDPLWSDFTNFLQDMGEAPAGLTLDRVQVNEGYSKANCEWADWDQQALNKRVNGTKLITYLGRTQSPRLWSEELNVNLHTIVGRRHRGWTTHEIFNGKQK